MNMKKLFALLAAMALLFSCAAFAEEEPAPVKTGVYTIFNKTGELVTEVKLTDNVTGETNDFFAEEDFNFSSDGIVVLYFDVPEAEADQHTLTLSYKTESGREEAFTTLKIEEATIELLAADAMTGATPIAFTMVKAEQEGKYTIYNRTGETVKVLNLIDNEEGTVIRQVFQNGLEPNETYEINYIVPADRENVTLTLQFVTESGKIGIFSTLKIEEVPITLLDVDSVSGATPIEFKAPETIVNAE